MLSKLRNHIKENVPKLQEHTVLLACSGGVDSVVLGHCLHQLKYPFAIAHCNFSLRGKESDEDAIFIKHLAQQWEVPLHIETFDTTAYAKSESISIQMAARELRYNWFKRTTEQFGYAYILTAHHKDDSLETFMINLGRGTGIKGLLGIPAEVTNILRPLLPFTKTEIETYAKQEALHWREDSSNAKADYLRNKLRLKVISEWKEQYPNLLDGFQKTQEHLLQSQALIEDYTALVFQLLVTETSAGYEISIAKLLEMPNPNALLYELLSPFGFTAWKDIKQLLSAQSGKQIFSSKYRLLKDRTTLIVTEKPSEEKKIEKKITASELQIESPLKMSFIPTEKMGYTGTSVIYVDADKLTYPLTLRPWKEGDQFQPFGMRGKKKLSKFFKDEKLSLAVKEQIFVLESNDQIVWVVGLRADDRFKVTKNTNTIVKITVID